MGSQCYSFKVSPFQVEFAEQEHSVPSGIRVIEFVLFGLVYHQGNGLYYYLQLLISELKLQMPKSGGLCFFPCFQVLGKVHLIDQ